MFRWFGLVVRSALVLVAGLALLILGGLSRSFVDIMIEHPALKLSTTETLIIFSYPVLGLVFLIWAILAVRAEMLRCPMPDAGYASILIPPLRLFVFLVVISANISVFLVPNVVDKAYMQVYGKFFQVPPSFGALVHNMMEFVFTLPVTIVEFSMRVIELMVVDAGRFGLALILPLACLMLFWAWLRSRRWGRECRAKRAARKAAKKAKKAGKKPPPSQETPVTANNAENPRPQGETSA